MTVYLSLNGLFLQKSVSLFRLLPVLLLLSRPAYAQLCTGSLGDPVVNITFGSGNNPGPQLPPSVTYYNYTVNPCPTDGFYTMVNRTSGCFGSTWHNVPEDHTPGDINGYMMLINASYQPGDFYVDTVKNLCGGTTYEFSAWVLNMLQSTACNGNGKMPNLSFSIETTSGQKIQTPYNTGNIPNIAYTQWNQYGFFFTLPPGVNDLVLRITNNSPGDCGNDLALDDITFRPCGPKVQAGFTNQPSVSDTVYHCFSDQATISFSGGVQSGFNNPAFQWQVSNDGGTSWQDIAGATNTTLTTQFSIAGTFLYRLSAAEAGNISVRRCRVASSVLTVIIDDIPPPGVSNNSPVCEQSPVQLVAHNGYQYAWSGPSGFSAADSMPVIPLAAVSNAGTYTVTVTTRGGCSRQENTTVIINRIPAASAGNDTSICESGVAMLQAAGGISYSWQPAAGLSNPSIANPVATPPFTTSYTVTVTGPGGCRAADSIRITVLTKPVAMAGPDKQIVAGNSVQLSGTISGDTALHFWTPPQYISDVNNLDAVVSPPGDMIYTLHVRSGNGCGTATDDVFIRVFQKIAIPNAFSPNGDGINDTWQIPGLDSYPESELQVFNRYGQPVFHSRGYPKPWNGTFNGKPLPSGTYYYSIDRKNNFPLLSGWIAVIR